ncbi:MAG: hypothetical protein DI616_03075 [Paracoccus denitrificans]|uniref:Sulfotransferase family protein n=1 Tax=Paracoccus denitrificans TaxID=266 RepID=A0A533I9I0_PARDE|nr:MAG: hypothetical protein DI616_03075 [Paracoccus denitrificans]
MARLHLHIGLPKTGTTALQAFCAGNGKLLASHGLAYYASRGDSCGSIVRAISKRAPIGPLRGDFTDWLSRQEGRDVIVSAEGFAACNPEHVFSVFAEGRWDGVDVIGYLRPQEAFLEGWYKQLVKWGNKCSLDEFLRPHAEFWGMGDYRPALRAWTDWCAANGHRRQFRVFDPRQLKGGDICSDVFHAIGRPDLPVASVQRNLSPSAQLTGLYLRLPPVERLQQINRVMVASGHPAATGSGDLLDAATVALIRNHYAAANAEIRNDHFPGHSRLFSNPPAPGPAPDPSGLDLLLIETLAKMRGPDVAARARLALRV